MTVCSLRKSQTCETVCCWVSPDIPPPSCRFAYTSPWLWRTASQTGARKRDGKLYRSSNKWTQSRQKQTKHYFPLHLAQHKVKGHTTVTRLLQLATASDHNNQRWRRFSRSTFHTMLCSAGQFVWQGRCSTATTEVGFKPSALSWHCGVDADPNQVFVNTQWNLYFHTLVPCQAHTDSSRLDVILYISKHISFTTCHSYWRKVSNTQVRLPGGFDIMAQEQQMLKQFHI